MASAKKKSEPKVGSDNTLSVAQQDALERQAAQREAAARAEGKQKADGEAAE